VKLWMDADEKSQTHQGLSALLVTAIDHELGHWMQTIKAGYCYLSSVPQFTDGLETDDLSTDLLADLSESVSVSDDDDEPLSMSLITSPSDLDTTLSSNLAAEHSDTAKIFQAPWMTGNGEAGNFVEVSTRGGIMEYDAVIKKPYLVVGRRQSDMHYLSNSYIKKYIRNEGPPESLRFRPSSGPSGTSPHSTGLETKEVNFPFDNVDTCLSPDLYSQNFHGYVPTKIHKL